MFLRPHYRWRNGKREAYWPLVGSYRTERGPRQRLLRTNTRHWSDEEPWRANTPLSDTVAAFRIQKSDLSLRPVWHQKQDRVLAHILVCFLACVLWKFLGQLCRHADLGDEPRRVLEELAELSAVDVVLPTKAGPELRLRCVTRPSDHQQILLQHFSLTLPARLDPIAL